LTPPRVEVEVEGLGRRAEIRLSAARHRRSLVIAGAEVDAIIAL
jgi:hypothetical protein